MKAGREYDVTVIGAGIAGMVAAVTANGLGKKVAIVEKRVFGGNCSSYTCLPSKTLIKAGRVANLFQNLEHYGLHTDKPLKLDTATLNYHIRTLTARVKAKDAADTFDAIGIKTFTGSAEFIDSHHVAVGERIISSNSFIIATGTRPMVPPIKGLQDVPYLTNETIYDLEKLPQSMLILGGGVAGLEFASSLAGLGVEVTVVEMSPRLLVNDDRELVNLLLAQLMGRGIRLLPATKAVAFSREENRVVLSVEYSDGKIGQLKADGVLLAIGRKAEMESLKLEKAGVKFTPRGIAVNETLQTSASNIYACGDIAGPYQLASTAEYQGILAATNAVLPVKRKADYANAAFVIFTEPAIVRLGLTEEQARQKYNDDVKVYRFDYNNMRRAMVDGAESGLAKIICNHKGQLVGAHIFGEGAPEVIHELLLIKGFNIPLHSVQKITHAYPTYAQAVVGRASQLAYLDHMNSNFLVNRFLRFVPGYLNKLEIAKRRLAEEPETSASVDTKTVITESKVDTSGRIVEEYQINIINIGLDVCLAELNSELKDLDEKPVLDHCLSGTAGVKGYLILDFSRVTLINGFGASMLVKLAALARRRGQLVIACGVNNHYRDVFNLTGLDRIIPVYASREEALSAVSTSYSRTSIDAGKPVDPRDTAFWAKPISRLVPSPLPPEAINMNVRDRRVVGPVLGFGQLWQKRYRLVIDKPGLTPEDVIRILKQNFPRFQPSFNRFYPSSKGIQPGEIVAIDSSTAGGPVSTGVMVLYADATSFTFITPQGHPESGWVTFNAYQDGQKIIAQIVGLARANDPVYEAAFHAVGSKMQVRIWKFVLNALAMYLGVPAEVTVEPVRIDPALQWSQMGNIWYNAQIRTILSVPARWLRRPGKQSPPGKT